MSHWRCAPRRAGRFAGRCALRLSELRSPMVVAIPFGKPRGAPRPPLRVVANAAQKRYAQALLLGKEHATFPLSKGTSTLVWLTLNVTGVRRWPGSMPGFPHGASHRTHGGQRRTARSDLTHHLAASPHRDGRLLPAPLRIGPMLRKELMDLREHGVWPIRHSLDGLAVVSRRLCANGANQLRPRVQPKESDDQPRK